MGVVISVTSRDTKQISVQERIKVMAIRIVTITGNSKENATDAVKQDINGLVVEKMKPMQQRGLFGSRIKEKKTIWNR